MNPTIWLSLATLIIQFVGQERALGHRPLIDFLTGKTNANAQPLPPITSPDHPVNQLLAGVQQLVSNALYISPNPAAAS